MSEILNAFKKGMSKKKYTKDKEKCPLCGRPVVRLPNGEYGCTFKKGMSKKKYTKHGK